MASRDFVTMLKRDGGDGARMPLVDNFTCVFGRCVSRNCARARADALARVSCAHRRPRTFQAFRV